MGNDKEVGIFTIIHGTNVLETRNQLQIIKSKYQEIISLDGKKVALTEILQALETATFDGTARLVVLENLLSGKIKHDDIIGYLLKNDFKNDLVIWEEKENKSKDLQNLSRKAQVIQLNLSTLLFKFMDNLLPASSNILPLYNELIEKESAELIFFMLKRHLRSLLLSRFSQPAKPMDFSQLLPWQLAKLTKQASLFDQTKLKILYKDLLKIEYEVKAGLTGMELDHKLRLFLTLNF